MPNLNGLEACKLVKEKYKHYNERIQHNVEEQKERQIDTVNQ